MTDRRKAQRKVAAAKYRAANQDKLRARQKAWRLANLEKSTAWAKRFYAANRDQLIAKKRLYNAARREEINAKSRARDAANPEKKRERAAIYRAANRAILREKDRAYQKANPGKGNARTMKRLAAQYKAMPSWADRAAIQMVYDRAATLSRETGIPHVVDHIYPLQGRTVCGLHVPANLRVITQSENCRKSNRHPDQLIAA